MEKNLSFKLLMLGTKKNNHYVTVKLTVMAKNQSFELTKFHDQNKNDTFIETETAEVLSTHSSSQKKTTIETKRIFRVIL